MDGYQTATFIEEAKKNNMHQSTLKKKNESLIYDEKTAHTDTHLLSPPLPPSAVVLCNGAAEVEQLT